MAHACATIIQQYDGAQQQLGQLQNSEANQRNIDGQVANATAELSCKQALLNKHQNANAYMQKRIHRNENPRFLHYFVCNRTRKVERLREELQDLVTQEQQVSNKIAQDSAQLANLRQQQQQAQSCVALKHQLESQCRSLFDQVVDAQPPTQALQQLNANLQQQRVNLKAEQDLLQAVINSVRQAQQGVSLFQQAERLYRQAHNVNERAKSVTRAEAYEERREFRNEVRGNEFGALCNELNRDNLESQERRLQAERDSLINQAHDVAINAYQVISTAFSTFPMQARARYPQLCTSIGQVALPRVEGANFSNALMSDMIFGTAGAAMNDFSSGCKIQNNMRVVDQCVSMTSQQLSCIQAIENAINTTIQQMSASALQFEQGISAERNGIFNAVRAAVAGA